MLTSSRACSPCPSDRGARNVQKCQNVPSMPFRARSSSVSSARGSSPSRTIRTLSPLEGKYPPWGPPPAFQIALEGAKSLGDLIKVPKGIVDGLHDVKIAAQVACLSKSMSELTRTGLFEERLAVLEKAVEAEELWTPLEGKNPEYTEPWSPKANPRGEPWMKAYDDNGKMRKQWLKYIDPRHQDGWTASSTAEKYRALLNQQNCCCLRVWNMLDCDPKLDKPRVYVLFEAFASMIISNGSTFIDIWELLIGGYDNMSALSDTDNRERLYEAQETFNDLLMQDVGMGLG